MSTTLVNNVKDKVDSWQLLLMISFDLSLPILTFFLIICLTQNTRQKQHSPVPYLFAQNTEMNFFNYPYSLNLKQFTFWNEF